MQESEPVDEEFVFGSCNGPGAHGRREVIYRLSLGFMSDIMYLVVPVKHPEQQAEYQIIKQTEKEVK